MKSFFELCILCERGAIVRESVEARTQDDREELSGGHRSPGRDCLVNLFLW